MYSLYQSINWQAPWYRTLMIPPCPTNFRHVKDWLNAAITPPIYNHQNKPIDFVVQDDLPAHTAYESFIAHTGKVPTRDNFHDLLGGLIWLNFPKTKAAFNRLHQQDIDQVGIQNTRTPLRNALTLFDENGGIVVSSDLSVLQALQRFDWQDALYAQRHSWQDHRSEFFPIGHALLEKLITPRKAITSHVLLIHTTPEWFVQSSYQQRADLDNFISRWLWRVDFMPKMLQPLPVMGIPGFCAQGSDFYADKAVFRDNRQARSVQIWTLPPSAS